MNSLYDTALIAWARALNPPLPSLDSPASNEHLVMFNDPSFRLLFDEDGNLRVRHDSFSKQDLESKNSSFPLPDREQKSHDPDVAAEIERMQANLLPSEGETRVNAVTRHLSKSHNGLFDFVNVHNH